VEYILALTLVIGVGLGFCLGVLAMAFFGRSEPSELSGRPLVRTRAEDSWRR
jgi:hypothetical protein